MDMPRLPFVLTPESLTAGLHEFSAVPPFPDSVWYEAETTGEALVYTFPPGALAGARFLSADWLLEGKALAVFFLWLQEGEDGPAFRMSFGLLNKCSARMRVPLEAVNQGRWRYPREGAWLKPLCGGDRVDLQKVDRMRIVIERKGPDPVHFCVTPVAVCAAAPPPLDAPLLPAGPLLDELGQSRLHDWPAKTTSTGELVARLQRQLTNAPAQTFPSTWSRWGGWLERQVEPTGFFRTHHDGERWWLVDPDGYLFWSSGLDCVRFGIDSAYDGIASALSWLPEEGSAYDAAHTGEEGLAREERGAFDYLRANFIRAFGDEAEVCWATIALSQLRAFGFNTVANWSGWEIARAAGVPYVRPMDGRSLGALPRIYRDFPDVYHPEYVPAAAGYAEQLVETTGDPAFIGYFLMNEPNWGFAGETPAAGMLYTTEACYARRALAAFLREWYGTDASLSSAWGMPVTFVEVAEGLWQRPLTDAARGDLAEFSDRMVVRYFGELSAACRRVDPHHLNLGIRYYTVPPAWAVRGMRSFDVFSMNCYRPRVLVDEMAEINALLGLPIMVGEWHFGALDVGLPASGIGHVLDQAARGQAFRLYLEDAAAKPWCVGVHYFTLYDQSAIGRFDGENYNIGFVDVCSQPYAPLAEAARQSHERLYRVASGALPPYDNAPDYLPMLFL